MVDVQDNFNEHGHCQITIQIDLNRLLLNEKAATTQNDFFMKLSVMLRLLYTKLYEPSINVFYYKENVLSKNHQFHQFLVELNLS